MDRYSYRLYIQKMAWRILIRYWYIVIPVIIILVNGAVLNSSHFVCRYYNNECYVNEKIFYIFEFKARDIDFNSINQFYSEQSKNPVPLINSDRNWYGIYAKTNNNKNELIMESYHSNQEKTNKIVDELNEQIGNQYINIDIKF